MEAIGATDGRGAVDVCYHIGNGSRWANNELRYSLRAMEKNFLDLGRVFIVGVKPPWLTGVEHLDVKDTHGKNKDANLIDKVLAACNAGISDQFVRSSDDETILLPSHLADLKPYHAGNLREKGDSFWGSHWKKRLKRTMELLQSRGATTFHFDTHLPKVYDRELFRTVMASCDYQNGNGYTIDTLYLNQAGLVRPPRLSGQKFTLEHGHKIEKIGKLRGQLVGKRYLGYNDKGLNGALKKVLQEMFPEPSRFEADGVKFTRGITFDDAPSIPNVVAVVGTPRSGTSCVAGIVHHLGVSMGEHLRAANRRNQRGFYEDVPLRKVCSNGNNRVKNFRQWAEGRKKAGPLIGGKDGKMCNQLHDMLKAWPGLKVVAVDRPISEVVASMSKTGTFKRFKTDAQRENFARKWTAHRDIDLDTLKIPAIRLAYHDVLANPGEAIRQIIEFLGISPTDRQIEAALAFVDPSLRHNHDAETLS